MRRSLSLPTLALALALGACASSATPSGGMLPAVETGAVSAGLAPGGGPTVIVVRHAERATDSPTDPSLTSEGEARAAALAGALQDAGVTHVITTELRRTRLTAAPLAARLGLTPEVVQTRGATPHVQAMVEAVRRRGPRDVVLVVGHSNTVPAYVQALGAPQVAPICDAQYDNLFVVTPGAAAGSAPRVVHAKYGAASPAC